MKADNVTLKATPTIVTDHNLTKSKTLRVYTSIIYIKIINSEIHWAFLLFANM